MTRVDQWKVPRIVDTRGWLVTRVSLEYARNACPFLDCYPTLSLSCLVTWLMTFYVDESSRKAKLRTLCSLNFFLASNPIETLLERLDYPQIVPDRDWQVRVATAEMLSQCWNSKAPLYLMGMQNFLLYKESWFIIIKGDWWKWETKNNKATKQ